jgi:hypothetical protein
MRPFVAKRGPKKEGFSFMVRKALALAVAGTISLSAPAFAADAQASASKAAVKATQVERTSAVQGETSQLTGNPDTDFWIFLLFGLISSAVIYDAIKNDKDPVSP